jgi:YVTN family beta-propeller protein
MLYVANFRSQWVTVYSIDDGKRVASIHVGDGPAALALSGDGHLLFVVDTRSGDVSVVRTSSNSLFTLMSTGKDPNAIAIKAFKLP